MAPATINPLDAAVDGCSASLTAVRTEDGFQYYRADATAASGWQFDHFDFVVKSTVTEYGTTRESSRTYANQSYMRPTDFQANWLCEGVYSLGAYYREAVEITRFVAVFVAAAGSITVTTAASPAQGGTTTPTSETRSGSPGQTAAFALVATPKPGYKFLSWGTVSQEGLAMTRTWTVTHTFTSAPQTFAYVAYFAQRTGQILRGASGAVLRGASGAVLYDG